MLEESIHGGQAMAIRHITVALAGAALVIGGGTAGCSTPTASATHAQTSAATSAAPSPYCPNGVNGSCEPSRV